ncbi:MAG: lactate utilization protein [Azonexus sp.]|nr:lactate utilization protein [Betaproteobacteria bacterium]MBK8917940.1 lactate utilization protein [Betaproteobacteria bacterium]MBP6036430.1 lactate utilization protein [Azonexus sp.]MBP6907039.1 lactate utilization protein [Azonexus sp.]
MNARDRIFARLQAASSSLPLQGGGQEGDGVVTVAYLHPHPNPSGAAFAQAARSGGAEQCSAKPRPHPLEGEGARVERLVANLTAARAEVHRVTPGNWVQKLYEILSAKKLTNLLLAPGTAHGARAAQSLGEAGIACLAYDRPIEAWKSELFNDVQASLTGARGAIAATGSLILWPDAQEPRLMSLVPPVHIVLLDAATIHATLIDAMRTENWAAGLPSNALLISSPSKTADIQQTLAYGAHGPKELVVLLEENI